MKCPECKGEGIFKADHYDKEQLSCDWAPIYCRTCKGTGKVPDHVAEVRTKVNRDYHYCESCKEEGQYENITRY